MALYVNTNVSSLNSNRNLANATNSLDTAYKRLASGLRINSAKDDAAGLQISNRLTSQINGLNQGNRNAQDGISYAQTAEGAMDEMTSMYQRIRTLALQSANGTNSEADRKAIQQEVNQLCQEITRIGNDTTYGGTHILDKSIQGLTDFQVGANHDEIISIDLSDGFRLDDVLMKIYNDTPAGPERDTLAGAIGKTLPQPDTGVTPPAFSVTAGIDTTEGEHTVKVTQLADSTAVSRDFTDPTLPFASGGTLTFKAGTGADEESFTVTVDAGDTLDDIVAKINSASGSFGVSATLDGNTLTLDSGKTGTDYATFSVTATGSDLADFNTASGWTTDKTAQDCIVEVDGTPLNSATNSVTDTASGITVTANSVTADAITFEAEPEVVFLVDTQANSQNALAVVDKFIAVIDAKRAELGAVQNRLESTIRNQTNVSENVSDARSRIRDADFASETAAMTQQNILQQASQSILSQANQRPQIALSLLQQ